jgi:hypothetical protein
MELAETNAFQIALYNSQHEGVELIALDLGTNQISVGGIAFSQLTRFNAPWQS